MKYKLRLNDTLEFELTEAEARALDAVAENGRLHILRDNRSWHAEILSADWKRRLLRVRVNGEAYEVRITDELDALIERMGLSANTAHTIADVKAPMPGLVVKVLVQPGDSVTKGQPLLILEAMKMENIIKAPGDATVKEVFAEAGQAVEKNQLLVRLD